MTIEEKLKEMLTERGMWPEQAERVMEKVKTLGANKPMEGRWQRDKEGYLPSLLSALWLSVRSIALEDIDANTPEAFYRCLFEEAH